MRVIFILAVFIVTVHGDNSTTIQVSPSVSASPAINATVNATAPVAQINATSASNGSPASTSIAPSPSTSITLTTTVIDDSTNLTFGNLDNTAKYQVIFKLDETWDANLADNTSSEYTAKRDAVVAAFDTLYQQDSHYVKTNINGFSQGSVKVDATILFNFPVGTNDTTKSTSTSKITVSSTAIGSLTIVANSASVITTVDGVWGVWTESGACNYTTVLQTQVRTCTGPFGGGAPCSGNATREIDCAQINPQSGGMLLGASIPALMATLVAMLFTRRT